MPFRDRERESEWKIWAWLGNNQDIHSFIKRISKIPLGSFTTFLCLIFLNFRHTILEWHTSRRERSRRRCHTVKLFHNKFPLAAKNNLKKRNCCGRAEIPEWQKYYAKRERDASDDIRTAVYIWNKKSINASTHSKEAFFLCKAFLIS